MGEGRIKVLRCSLVCSFSVLVENKKVIEMKAFNTKKKNILGKYIYCIKTLKRCSCLYVCVVNAFLLKDCNHCSLIRGGWGTGNPSIIIFIMCVCIGCEYTCFIARVPPNSLHASVLVLKTDAQFWPVCFSKATNKPQTSGFLSHTHTRSLTHTVLNRVACASAEQTTIQSCV